MADEEPGRILIRVGSIRPPVGRVLRDEFGRPVDLTSATRVDAVAVDWTGAEKWRNAAVVADAAAGEVTYQWRAADTAVAGNYGLYFEATWPDATTTDYPLAGPIDLVVAEPGSADLDPYVVPIDRLARRIGIPDAELEAVRDVLEMMTDDVQADVEGYLGRPLMPTRFVEPARADYTDPSGYRLAWDPVVRIISAVEPADPNGLWTVDYVAGIDNPIAQRSIARYVTGAVIEEFRAHPTYGKAYRSVRSLSAGGRSISWDQPAGASRRSMAQLPAFPQPGSMPSIETLARWRKRGVFSRLRFAAAGATAGGQYGYGSGIYLLGDPSEGAPLFYGNARTGEVWPQ